MPASKGGGGGTRKVIRRKPAPVIHDDKSNADRKRAETYKRTPAYRKTVRDTYSAQSTARKQQLVKTAKGPEGRVIRKTHADRANRKLELARGAATKDTKGNADRARAEKFTKTEQYKNAIEAGRGDKKVGIPLLGSINVTKLGVQGSIGKQLGAELQGKGLLANVGGKLASSSAFTKAIAPAISPLPGKLGQNAAKDALNIPGQALPSAFLPAREIAHGRPKKAGEMLIQPYKDLAKDPGKMALEHPLGTALLVRGGTSAVGRGAGKTLRTVPSKTTRRIASTKRAPAVSEHTKMAQGRSYSPDIIEKGVQVAAEKRKIRKAEKIRAEAKAEHKAGNTERAVELRQKADKADPLVMKPKAKAKRIDVIQEGGEVRRRKNAAKTDREIQKGVGRKGTAPALVAQNITKNSVDSLKAELGRLETEHPKLDSDAKRIANEKLRKDITKAIKTHDPARVDAQAAAYKESAGSRGKLLVEKQIISKDTAETRPLIPYAVKDMGARVDSKLGLVDKDGAPLPNGAVRAHMKANGHADDPAWVTHRPDFNSGSAYFQAGIRPPTAGTKRTTGKATIEGTHAANTDALRASARRQQSLIDADDTWKDSIGEAAYRRPDTGNVRLFAKKSGPKSAESFLRENGLEDRFAVVRGTPWTGAQKGRIQSLLEDTADEIDVKPVADALIDALEGNDGPGPWVLVDKHAQAQMLDHANSLGLGKFGKGWNVANSQFRKVVLTLSPAWALGNVVEATARSAVLFAGPRSRVTYGKALTKLRETDPKLADKIDNEVIGSGGEFGLAKRGQRHTVAEEFMDPAGPKVAQVARLFGAARRTHGPKEIADGWGLYTDFVLQSMAKLETQFKKAQAGKFIRDELMSPTQLRTGRTAVAQAAEGLKGTPEQVKLAEYVQRGYGKYEAWSPAERKVITLYTPFAAWLINAARFTFVTLPKDHPILSAVLASAYIASEEWRKGAGLDPTPFSKGDDGQMPSWLQGSIPLPDGGHLRIGRYLPTSFATDPLGNVGSAVLPQAASIQMAAKGLDWTGKPIKDKSKEQAIAEAFFGAYIPGYSIGDRVKKKGVLGTLNPVPVIPPKEASSSTGRKKGSGRSWSGGQSGRAWSSGGSGHKWSK